MSAIPPESTMTVLVVDDQQSMQRLLQAGLEASGHRVLAAQGGEEAIRLFRAASPDLVLLDVEMPGVDGYAVARALREAEPEGWTPIIFLSVRADPESQWKGIEAGGDDYLSKPVDPLVLRAKLHAMRRLHQMRRRLESLSVDLTRANERLQSLSAHDALTGLLNRRAFDEALAREVAQARRDRLPLTLVLCDVDHFKDYNDHAGHLQGDACLQRVAALLQSACRRPRDVAARYGGEEFALILPNTPRSGAAMFARALLQGIRTAGLPHPMPPQPRVVSLSGGSATWYPERSPWDPQELLAQADAALYEAKRAGRGRIHAAHPDEDTRPTPLLD